MVLEKTLAGPLDCKEIEPVHPKENQSWLFIGRTDAKAETPILWPPDAKNWLTGKRPWCWERLKAGKEGDDRGWDGWMASLTQWTWVWASSVSWWWRRKPGMLQSMGLQRVGHDWVTELNWLNFQIEKSLSSVLGNSFWSYNYMPIFPGSSAVKNLPVNARDSGSIPELGRSPGKGNGNPFQYPCLQSSMDRRAWHATVHGITKSQTRLKRLGMHTLIQFGRLSPHSLPHSAAPSALSCPSICTCFQRLDVPLCVETLQVAKVSLWLFGQLYSPGWECEVRSLSAHKPATKSLKIVFKS